MAATAAATVPATIGGFSLATHWGGGFHWLAAAGLLSIPGALYGARVLLVETLSFHQRGDFVVTGDHKVTALLNWGHQRRAVRPRGGCRVGRTHPGVPGRPATRGSRRAGRAFSGG